MYAEILEATDSGGKPTSILEPGSLLGQMDEAFWVGGSSGSLLVTKLQH